MKIRYILAFVPLVLIIFAFVVVSFLLDEEKVPKYYLEIDEKNIENVIDLIEYLEIDDFREAKNIEMTEVTKGFSAKHNEYYVILNYISQDNEEKTYKNKNGFQINEHLNEKVYKAVYYIKKYPAK